jgi:ABC-type uncharacterized transport system substrate-binding protein
VLQIFGRLRRVPNRLLRQSASSTQARHPASQLAFVAAFRKGLKDTGLVERENLAVEYRYWAGRDAQLAASVAELVRRPVAVLVGNTPPAVAAKKITSTIPIVFATGADPVKLGLVASFNRPGATRRVCRLPRSTGSPSISKRSA